MSKRGTYERRARLGLATIHILRHGFPACLFTTLSVEDWPVGHRWMRDDQPRHKITCEKCLGAAKAGGF